MDFVNGKIGRDYAIKFPNLSYRDAFEESLKISQDDKVEIIELVTNINQVNSDVENLAYLYNKDAIGYEPVASFGLEPFVDVLYAAEIALDKYNIPSSELNKYELATLAIVVTYYEAGNENSDDAPSPMAVSRGDGNNAALWSFNDYSTSNPYVRAHWNPGIGLWQIDDFSWAGESATHERINTETSATIAVDRLAANWYKVDGTFDYNREYAWKDWYGCKNTTWAINLPRCENLFDDLYNENQINISLDPTVSRTGGMISDSSCKVGETINYYESVPCYYVDMENIEGSTVGYTNDNGGGNQNPKPLPFYNFTLSYYEYRSWLKYETGYNIDIDAIRILGENSREGLEWRDDSLFLSR
ncbi:hypothetical protein [Chengkuizengella axinellae]|uniref:Transglycosylase SLT domain-containing protein n=1 Tax=Chengkuizengella axinellae TaxID=3064388 RepID=A0ABT9IXD5_9BACL|nr:hypothetical protein [Chengkuizengella sp. 2205SS18-9]MDP5274006.1 hypothetical protein [Chengkuizengella sp. 2205SS18-9]